MTGESLLELERRLWSAADELRANSRLRANEYSVPVLGLIFLKHADVRFHKAESELQSEQPVRSRRALGKEDYQARGILYIPNEARYESLLALPEGEDLGRAVNEAMRSIEADNPDLRGVLPKTYNRFDNRVLSELFRTFNGIPDDIDGDAFGRIYEYFLSNFAMAEGQRGGEFFTPTSIVRLIVEVIEPFGGRILDPACGSGGMFVQSADFVRNHRNNGQRERLSIYGQERVAETIRLAQMNLAVHGLTGDIRQGNTYYENLHNMVGRFDYVMANPPFNVDSVDKSRLEDEVGEGRRFPFGLPNANNANYLWIQMFYSALNEKGRAGFVMANSASDARYSELEIRKKLLQEGVVDVVVMLSSNFFYTVTLPVTLWFLNRGKPAKQQNSVLFIDARKHYRQITRALRDFSPVQGEFLANIVRLYRNEAPDTTRGSKPMMEEHFPGGTYRDVPGLCSVATLRDIEQQSWSLNPARYVGAPEAHTFDDVDFGLRMEQLREEFALLSAEAHELEQAIDERTSALLEHDS